MRYFVRIAWASMYLTTATGGCFACTNNLLAQTTPMPTLNGELIFQAQAADGLTHLYYYDFASGNRRLQLDSTWGLCYVANPKFSPDGNWIAFSGKVGSAENCLNIYRQVYVFKLGSLGQPYNVFNGAANDLNQDDPSFSPDGSSIIFKNAGNLAISQVTLNADGSATPGAIIPITADTAEDSAPSLTPTGKYVYYYQGSLSSVSLWRRSLQSGVPTQVATDAYYPVARDLTSILFVRHGYRGDDQIYYQLPDLAPSVLRSLALNDCHINNSDPAVVDEDLIIFSRPPAPGQVGSAYELYLGLFGTSEIWSLSSLPGINEDLELTGLLGASYHARLPAPSLANAPR